MRECETGLIRLSAVLLYITLSIFFSHNSIMTSFMYQVRKGEIGSNAYNHVRVVFIFYMKII
jgi:hypothetical protein